MVLRVVLKSGEKYLFDANFINFPGDHVVVNYHNSRGEKEQVSFRKNSIEKLELENEVELACRLASLLER